MSTDFSNSIGRLFLFLFLSQRCFRCITTPRVSYAIAIRCRQPLVPSRTPKAIFFFLLSAAINRRRGSRGNKTTAILPINVFTLKFSSYNTCCYIRRVRAEVIWASELHVSVTAKTYHQEYRHPTARNLIKVRRVEIGKKNAIASGFYVKIGVLLTLKL